MSQKAASFANGVEASKPESPLIVRSQVHPAVMVDQAKTNTIQPSNSAEHIPVDHRIGKEVDHGVRGDTENTDFQFVTEGLKSAVRSPEPHKGSVLQGQPQRLRDFCAKNTKRCSGVDAGSQADLPCARAEDDRYDDAFIFAGIVVDMREFEFVHTLPAAERHILISWNTREEGFADSCRSGRRSYVCQFRPVRNQSRAIKSHPFA